MKENKNAVAAVALLLLRLPEDSQEAEVLLGRRAGSSSPGEWAPPAEHIETTDPTPTDAGLRGLLEETGLVPARVVRTDLLNKIYPFAGGTKACVYVQVTALASHLDTPQLREPHRATEWRWFPVNALPTPRWSSVDDGLDKAYRPFFTALREYMATALAKQRDINIQARAAQERHNNPPGSARHLCQFCGHEEKDHACGTEECGKCRTAARQCRYSKSLPLLTEQERHTVERWVKDPQLYTPVLGSHAELLRRAAWSGLVPEDAKELQEAVKNLKTSGATTGRFSAKDSNPSNPPAARSDE